MTAPRWGGRGTATAALVLLALGAAPVAAQRAATVRIVWPPPPEPPRVEYAGFLTSEADIGKREGFLGRVFRGLVGGRRDPAVRLHRPFDVHVEPGGRFFVTDGVTRGLILFDRERKEARLLGDDVPGGLAKPMGLGGDGLGNVYVTDQGSRRIAVFRPDGRHLRVFGGPAVLLNPVDVAVDAAANRVYVADSYLHQVVVFDTTGRLLQRLGRDDGDLAARRATVPAAGPDATGEFAHGGRFESRDLVENRGAGPGEFRYPGWVAVGPDGTLYVSDQLNFRIQSFDRTGGFRGAFGQLGDRPGSFARPKGVGVDRHGHVYVVDAAFNNVQVFDDQGRLLMVIGGGGHGEGEHWLPLGLAVDAQNRIYVADRYNNRIQIYRYLDAPEPVRAEPAPGQAGR